MTIFDAIEKGDRDAALAALAADPSTGMLRHESGPTPVLYALYQGQTGIGQALGDQIPELDMAEAAALDRPARLRALLDAGGEPDTRTADGFTPLQLAAFFGAPNAAALLVERGADLDAVADNPMRIQPLHAASAGRHTDVALLLINAGAQLDGRQQHGWTPLLSAAHNGSTELVSALLAAGADPDAANDDGLTPAQAARAQGHDAIADQLDAASRVG